MVAGLEYRYAVKIEDATGKTRFAKNNDDAVFNADEAWWLPYPHTGFANHWSKRATSSKVSIVRRLVSSDLEAVE